MMPDSCPPASPADRTRTSALGPRCFERWRSVHSKYQSDIANTPCFAVAGCPACGEPCCRHGVCQIGSACFSPADTLPACADAGGACSPFVTECGSQGAGPPDSCAYPDEMCCLP